MLCAQTTVAHSPAVALVFVAHDWYIGQAGSPSAYRPSGLTRAAHWAGVTVASMVNSSRTSAARPVP